MKLIPAKDNDEWSVASRMLLRTANYLDEIGCPLWTSAQVSIATLKNTYRLEDLYFLLVDAEKVGLVFLQQSDPFFWPEITGQDSLFIHKLALGPTCIGKSYGTSAIKAIVEETNDRGRSWVRLDCDDRPALHRFYQGCGFELVDIKQIETFRVARYKLQIDK